MFRLKLIPFISLCLFSLTSCATLFTSRQQNITFDSNEKNVEIYINGQKICETPCSAKVDRSRDTMLIVGKKEGFEDVAVTVNSGANVAALLNLISLVTGSTGLTTDITDSHAWEYSPNAFYLTMEEANDVAKTPNQEKAYEQKIRKYVLANYSDIKAAAVYESDEKYLKALAKMTSVPQEKIENLVTKSKDEADFTNMMIREYKKNK